MMAGPILLLSALAAADTLPARFYAGRDWGTESQFNPLTVVLNESWDISQLEDNSHDVRTLWASDNFGRLNGSIFHPVESIQREGPRRFWTTEVVPTSFAPSKAQWLPNYQLHLLGGGMRNAELEEWYARNDCEQPVLAAAATSMLAGYMNEVSEIARNPSSRTADPVADIWIFDIGGVVLFQSDAVKDFFSTTLRTANWPLQPTWMIGETQERNAGEYWVVKWDVPRLEGWRLFYHVGLGNIAGVSRDVGRGNDLTVAGGVYTHHVVQLGGGAQTVSLEPKFGVFWDRENSLLASAFWNSQSVDRFLVNLYPGSLPTGPWKIGFWISPGRWGSTHVGLTGTLGLGAGI
jgi:hypothetical protein